MDAPEAHREIPVEHCSLDSNPGSMLLEAWRWRVRWRRLALLNTKARPATPPSAGSMGPCAADPTRVVEAETGPSARRPLFAMGCSDDTGG